MTPEEQLRRNPAAYFASRGYVVVLQDCRGRYNSEGTFYLDINEGQDGYDTVEWAARQQWSNGKVGTYGDSYLECDYEAIEASFRASGKTGLMTVLRNDDRWDRSNVELDRGRIVRYDKRSGETGMHHIDYGLGILTPAAFEPWQDDEQPFDLAVVYQRLIMNRELAGFEVKERFYEIGSLEGLEETRALLAARSGERHEDGG